MQPMAAGLGVSGKEIKCIRREKEKEKEREKQFCFNTMQVKIPLELVERSHFWERCDGRFETSTRNPRKKKT